MNSRERVLMALNHQEPDRVPVDFGGHRSSGIAVQAYRNLREYLGLPKSELFVYDVVQQLAVIEDDVYDILGTDVLQLGYDLYKSPEFWKEWKLHDGTEIKIPKHINIQQDLHGNYFIKTPKGKQACIQKKECLYFEQTEFPYYDSDEEEFEDLEKDLEEIMWVSVNTPFDALPIGERGERAKALRETTDKAILGAFGGGMIELGEQAFRMDNYLMELIADRPRIERFCDQLVKIHLRRLEKYLEEVGLYIDVILFGDDLGMQTGSQISADMFNLVLRPRYEQEWKMIKEKAPHLKIQMHCCGSIHNLLPHLIDAGLDAFNPVQISCYKMEPERLKADFGKDMVFWGGGCDTGCVLSRGTPAQIKEHVKRNIDILKPDGGFVFQQVHNILADVPPQNIVAMFEAVKEYGSY